MVGFVPVASLLRQTDELKNLSHAITYTDNLGASHPVTITPVSINNTITIIGNVISGYFSDCFNNTIYYRNKDDTFTTVTKFSDINQTNISELIHYFADKTTDVTYEYVATANGESKTYSIVVTNNWDSGKDQLLRYVNMTRYDAITISWVNSDGQVVLWKNNVLNNINWISNQ